MKNFRIIWKFCAPFTKMDLLKCGNYVKPLKNVHSFQAMGMTKLKNMGQGSFLKYFKSIFFKAVN